jgi:hypothetical protein
MVSSTCMKKGWILMIGIGLAWGCNNSSPVNKEKVDQLGHKFDSAAEKLWDSTKKEGKEIGNKLKEKMDSVRNK